MTCADIAVLIEPFIEGDLEERVARPVAAHIEGCPECAARVMGARETVTALESLPMVEPPPFMVEAVAMRIARMPAPRPEPRVAWPWLLGGGGMVLAAAISVPVAAHLAPEYALALGRATHAVVEPLAPVTRALSDVAEPLGVAFARTLLMDAAIALAALTPFALLKRRTQGQLAR